METLIKKVLLENAVNLFGSTIDEKVIQFQKTRKDVLGDLTLVVFPFAKILKCSPVEAGEKIGAYVVGKAQAISSYSVINGFLNFVISDTYWLEQLAKIDVNAKFGYADENSKSTIMVEYSSPNTNKPLHLGHLRNNFLGYSVAEILKANGHKVVKTQIINDRGIHICKSMLAWQEYSPLNEKGERETPDNTGMKGDKLVGKYYVLFDQYFNAQAREIIASWEKGETEGFSEKVIAEFERLTASKHEKDDKVIAGIDAKIKDLAKNETAVLRDAKEMLIMWEARDPQVYLLWTTMNGWVYKGFEKTYETMGVDFDTLYYESETFLIGKDLVAEGLASNVFFKKEDGSVWIDLTEDGLDEKIVLRSDGTAVYMTQDVGTAVDRFKDYPDLTGIIYTVGNEQDYHFRVLFLILKKLGYAWAEECYHLSYGMVELRNADGEIGKMKSREGTVVDADELMGDVIQAAKEMTQERGHIEGMSDEEKNALFYKIGMGGLKYYLLRVDPKKSMAYNPEESIELNGNTGPFIQYAHARIKSLLAKGDEIETLGSITSIAAEEKEILKHLNNFPATVADAGINHSPALITNYAYELVKLYNSFYQSVSVLNEEDPKLRNMRLMLSRNVAKVIDLSMRLLGISVPERM
ncbi:MAG: arginyl-tRNA synthetase [Crocinitomicaceae bacterium]|jgi:arginyl-tRNA synthetase